ncbi:hypothetical protein PIB30_095495, partial [Stylosanthes scabra]|nr:hypothetical protein [Stylosanthes scabra]
MGSSTPFNQFLLRFMCGREYLIAAGLWWIWRNRCNLIFNPENLWTPHHVAILVQHSAEEFLGLHY